MTDVIAEQAVFELAAYYVCSKRGQHLLDIIRKELSATRFPCVDELAQIIRQVDGSNSLGAGSLAEAIIEAIKGK